MLHYPGATTIKILNVEPSTLYVEGRGALIGQHAFASFLEASTRPDFDPTTHSYAGNMKYAVSLRGGNDDEVRLLLQDRLKRVAEFDVGALEPLPVRVNCDGKIELLDGHHRAIMAMAKGIRSIRVAVKYVSPLWQAMSDELFAVLGREWIYNAIDHPWFEAWETMRPRGHEREVLIFDAIEKHRAQIPSISLYEIGCCTGKLARYAESRRWVTAGLESSALFVRVAERLNEIAGTNVTYYQTNDFEAVLGGDAGRSTGVIVCLSVLHHWLRDHGDTRYVEAVRTIADGSWMFVIDQEADGCDFVPQSGTSIPLDRFAYAQWLRMEIGCTYVEYLGSPDMGRPIFLCSRRIGDSA